MDVKMTQKREFTCHIKNFSTPQIQFIIIIISDIYYPYRKLSYVAAPFTNLTKGTFYFTLVPSIFANDL